MQAIIQASHVTGTIQAPPSKSAMQRACAAALLTEGTCIIHHPGRSNDDQAALSIIQQLGARVQFKDDYIIIESQGWKSILNTSEDTIDCGESGLSIRMFTPIIALSERAITITGKGSLQNRTMEFWNTIFPELQVQYDSNDNCIPLKIQGPLIAKNIKVDGSKSSQYITGLLMAYSIAAEEDTLIQVQNLASKPYIELTLGIMQHFQMNVPEVRRMEIFKFQKSETTIKQIEYTVEADWSSASFLMVAAAINGDLKITGLNTFSAQADAAIMEVFEDASIEMIIEDDDSIHIQSSSIQAFEFDATDCPDLFPPLVALACHANGISKIKGVHRLINKESNRQMSLETEFRKLGINIYTENDTMYIEGNTILGANVSSHNDHRIAMALAVAGLKSNGNIIIEGIESVHKSFPTFWEEMKRLGMIIQ